MKTIQTSKNRIAAALLLTVALVLLSGCLEKSEELRTSIINQANTTADSVKNTVEDVKNQAIKTKESVEKKVDEVNTAVKEVEEAVDAVKKAAN